MALTMAFSRLCMRSPVYLGHAVQRILIAPPVQHQAATRTFHATAVLCAEPLKKKKRIDPSVIKAREERRKKKIEKQIRRLEKNARQLKPIDEMEVPLVLIDEKTKRTRTGLTVAADVQEQRSLLEKRWARHKQQEKLELYQQLDKLLGAQNKALLELRFESGVLYEQAIQPDFGLLPLVYDGPTATPVSTLSVYESPDGDYQDVSKKWE